MTTGSALATLCGLGLPTSETPGTGTGASEGSDPTVGTGTTAGGTEAGVDAGFPGVRLADGLAGVGVGLPGAWDSTFGVATTVICV